MNRRAENQRRITSLNDELNVLRRELQETKRLINDIIDNDFTIDRYTIIGQRIANLKLRITEKIRQIENLEILYSPENSRRNPSDMKLFLHDGQQLRCRDNDNFIGTYNLDENIIEYNGVRYRSLSNFASLFYDYKPNGWNVVKKQRGNHWISIDILQGNL